MNDCETIFNISIGSPITIDRHLFELWLQAYTVEESVAERIKNDETFSYSDPEMRKLLENCIKNDILDEYRVYELLEPFFTDKDLEEHCFLHIGPEIRQYMTERYFQFDETLVRQLLGEKLTNKPKLRSSVVNLSDKFNIKHRAALRYFDNLQRVYQEVMDSEEEERKGISTPESNVSLIQKEFCLSENTASLYSRIVFLARYRYDTHKKQLSLLNFDTFNYFAKIMITHWADPSGDEIDPIFIEQFGERFRHLFDNTSFNLYRQTFENIFLSESKLKNYSASRCESSISLFTPIIKTLLQISAGLSRSKLLRNLFVDLLDDVVTPLQNVSLDQNEADLYLTSIIESCTNLNLAKPYLNLWIRWLRGAIPICCRMYRELYR